MTWTKITKATLTTEENDGWGDMAWGDDAWGSPATTGNWTKITKAISSWTKITKETE